MNSEDIGSYFYFGSTYLKWIVIGVTNDNTCLCMMIGTDDCAIFSQHMIMPLINEYKEYWKTYNKT